MPARFRLRTGAALVTCAAVAGALAGCTAGHAATPSLTLAPPATSAPAIETPTPTPTPTIDLTVEPVRPAILDGPPSKKAAIAAAKYFLALYNYAYWTGDTTALATMSDGDCIFCNNVLKDIEKERAAGYTETGGAFRVVKAGALKLRSDFYTASIDLVQAPSSVTDAAGAVVHSAPASNAFHFGVALRYTDSWKIAEVSVDKA